MYVQTKKAITKRLHTMQITQNIIQVIFKLNTVLTVNVLKHLKQRNIATNDYNSFKLTRIKTSNMFKYNNYIVSKNDLQHLINSKQITIQQITAL